MREIFAQETFETSSTGYHPYPEFGKDLKELLEVLEEMHVFMPQTVRWHPTFQNLKHVLLEKFTHKELLAKVKASINAILLS